jgi:ribonuclease HII
LKGQDWTLFEKKARGLGFNHIAGVDEAGRGPLAGPVVAAAVILPETHDITHINDSKKLSEDVRLSIFDSIKNHPTICYGIGIATHEEIDAINILQATFLAMNRAVANLAIQPDILLIDGNRSPKTAIKTWAIVKGDALSESIALASIIAKCTRDQMMLDLDQIYPNYGFKQHKGYPTKAHRLAVQIHGLSPVHRKTFSSKPD